MIDSTAYPVEIPKQFINLHQDTYRFVQKLKAKDLLSIREKVFINHYQIHYELVSATIELIKSESLTHISSSMIMRSVIENVANLKHITVLDEKIATKYLKKSVVFDGKSSETIISLLRKGRFKYLARYDDSTTDSRVAELAESSRRVYDLLSAYTHTSPFITVQINAQSDNIIDMKRKNIGLLVVMYIQLLFDGMKSGMKSSELSEIINGFIGLNEQLKKEWLTTKGI